MLCHHRSSPTDLPQLQNPQDYFIPIKPESSEPEYDKETETMGSEENNKMGDSWLADNFEENEIAFIESMGLTPEDMLDYLQLPINIPSDEILHGKCPT
jgi:hypothetical protein